MIGHGEVEVIDVSRETLMNIIRTMRNIDKQIRRLEK